MTWFDALGDPLAGKERAQIAAYLQGLGMDPNMPLRAATTWREAGVLCKRQAEDWWHIEETERARLERGVRLDPADATWLELSERIHGAAARAAGRSGGANAGLVHAAAGAASHAAYQARLAQAAGAPPVHPFLRKYALYRGGRWPLGVYDGEFAIF